MDKKTTNIFLGIVLVGILILVGGRTLGLFSITGSETMIRSTPNSVNVGENFMITYSTTASGNWAATIEDSLSGGCTFPGGNTQIKIFMFSGEGNSKQVLINTPNDFKNCSFSGDYQFGNSSLKEFQGKTITLSTETFDDGDNNQTDDGDNNQTDDGDNNQTDDGDNNQTDDGDNVPSLDVAMTLFSIGDFDVTILHLLILIGLIILLKLVMGN
jgi:hypothetical protein